MAPRSNLIGQALSSFGRLSSRERLLVSITALALVLFVFVGGIYLVQGRLSKAERRLGERKSQLQQVLGLESQFRQSQQDRQRFKKRLERNDVQLFSLLPKVAGELGLTLNDLNERRNPLKESGVDEISVDVNLKQMSLDKLDAFLQGVENASRGGLVKILKIKVKTRFDNPELLDVNMKVATYKPASAG